MDPATVWGSWDYDVRALVIPPEEQEPLGVTLIPRARVQGRYCNVFDSSRRLYTSASWYGRAYREMNMELPLALWGYKALMGRTLVLGSQWSGNYYHWLIDCLGKFVLFLQCGGTMDSIQHVLIPRPPNASADRFIDVLGIDRDKIVWSEDQDGVRVEEAVVPDYPGHQGITHPLILRGLAARYRPAVRQNSGAGFHSKLLVTRDNWDRRLLNQQEVLDLLSPLGFRHYPLEDRLESQQADFYHADFIVAQQGSALTNLVFCKPGTRVVEIYSPDHPHPSFLNLCQALELPHTLVWGSSEGHRRPLWNSPAFKSKLDVRVDIDLLSKCLGQLSV